MFSGIIQHQASILAIQDGLFTVKNMFSEPLKIGQSIAHDGACMTLTNVSEEFYSFFAMEETLRITNLGHKSVGGTFNVEHALRMGDFLDGHLVSGHIDTIARVSELVYNEDGSLFLTVEYDILDTRFVMHKGSIAINGVSLTLVTTTENTTTVSLIPLTQSWTNLGTLTLGQSVNIEYDMMAKFVANMLPSHLTS